MKAGARLTDLPEADSTPPEPGRGPLFRAFETMVALMVSAAFALGATSVYAYWSAAPGYGSAVAATATMQPVVVSALTGGDAPTSTLIPGGSADVILRVTNPNPAPVQVYSVQPNGAIFADAAFPACSTTGVTFTPPSAPITPTITVDPNSSLLVHLEGAASMGGTSDSGCQGALFHVPVTLTARQ